MNPHPFLKVFTTLAIVAVIVFAAGAVSPTSAQGDPLIVTKTADTNDGVCDTDCSLREAMIIANTLPGPDTIILPAGTYTLTIAGAGENAATTGDLDITDSVTI
ncbi:MAG: CSLREA domain-containing protein, partial [Roseiflexaceae bacterium]|nr:CSLREA domain-containing protein [Roseiflexaceae bacterium]